MKSSDNPHFDNCQKITWITLGSQFRLGSHMTLIPILLWRITVSIRITVRHSAYMWSAQPPRSKENFLPHHGRHRDLHSMQCFDSHRRHRSMVCAMCMLNSLEVMLALSVRNLQSLIQWTVSLWCSSPVKMGLLLNQTSLKTTSKQRMILPPVKFLARKI